MESLAVQLKCVTCGREYRCHPSKYLCDDCGKRIQGELFTFPGILEVEYDYEKAKKALGKEALEYRKPGVWKYRELLPLDHQGSIVSLGEGGTPLAKSERLGPELGLDNLYLKDETLNPSGCFKDRETAVAISKCREFGFATVAGASTGSSGVSLAMYAAKAGLSSYIFVPADSPRGKIVQMLIHGAYVIAVHSIYEGALKLEIEACREYGWYNCGPAVNPFRLEANKTIAYEICEDLDWRPPDRVIVPTGGGGNLSGQWKGFREFFKLGFISSLPRMTAVQVEAGASLAEAFLERKDRVAPVEVGDSIAGSIRSAYCDYGPIALRTLKESGGSARIVNDSDILEAQELTASTEGIFAEPSGAAAIAGLVKMVEEKEIDREECVVCLITGSGLRELDQAAALVEEAAQIEPSMEALQQALQEEDS